jgi:exodeoxyribonuclease VII large subunit
VNICNTNHALVGSVSDKDLTKPLRVSQLIALLKADVEEKHKFVSVLGEISSFKEWRSGHCYFDIKDEKALIPAVMFRPHFKKLSFEVLDGLQVIASGRISIYAANSRLQMIVERIEPIGHGALALAFEQLKERLRSEGLFEQKHKKSIKFLNPCVGIVTSSHGAVLRDMVRILKNRMPFLNILFSPVRVQGTTAGKEIKTAIELLDSMDACDVIIVGRGGGAIEDLWAFNEEIVARAIFAAKTPIISAVGHETDTTISDFVADLRAATPTHAATLVAPLMTDIENELSSALASLKLKQEANLKKYLLGIVREKKRIKDPRVLLFRHWQRLDETSNQLIETFNKIYRNKKQSFLEKKNKIQQLAPYCQLRLKKDALFDAKIKLADSNPGITIKNKKQALRQDLKTLSSHINAKLTASRFEFEQSLIRLEALSPLKILSRGYSLVQSKNGQILSRLSQFTVNECIKIRVDDGEINAVVTHMEQQQ